MERAGVGFERERSYSVVPMPVLEPDAPESPTSQLIRRTDDESES